MRTMIILILTTIFVILITSTYKPSEKVLILGHYKNEKNAIKDFSSDSKRIIDIVNDINTNKVKKINNKEITIQNALIKSKKVIINYNNVENIKDLENVFNLIRKYCKEQVTFNTKTKNKLITDLCDKNQITCNFLLQ